MNAWRMSRDGVSAILGASALAAAAGLLVPVRVLNAQDGAPSEGGTAVNTVTGRPATGPGVNPEIDAPAAAPSGVPAPGASSASGAPGGPAPADDGAQGVRVSDYMTVDIFVQDEELATVLNMLSLQSRRNIVASKDVSATVSANLYGVTFYEALDSILNVNGYGYIEKGNFIYVYPVEKIQEINEAERKPVSKVIRLNYLNAVDAAEFVKGQLSEIGQIQTNGDVGDFSIPEDTPTGGEDFALSATMVVTDYPEHIEEIEKLIAQLDSRPSQVLVEATILQTQLTEENAFGVDFSVLGDIDFHDFIGLGGPLDTTNLLNDGDVQPPDDKAFSGTSTAGNSQGSSTVKIGILTDSISVFVRALDEVSDVTILSNPKLLVLNRQPARVLVGRKIGYLNTTSTETSTTQTVEFLDTGTQLNVKPFVSNDGMIRLELKPRVSEGVIRTATDVEGSAVTIPDEITQELTTNIIVPDGSTVVLGGLFKETTTLERRQIPILGDIPIVGLPFRGHEDSTDRAEIIFMIRTSIVNEAVMEDQGVRALSFAEDVRAGARNGLLPFSRDKMSMQMNVEAERLASEGNGEKAAWLARRSLELNPAQPDAIRLLRRVGDEDRRTPQSSILDRVISGEVDSILPARTTAAPSPAAAQQQADTGSGPSQTQPIATQGEAELTQSPATFETPGAVEVVVDPDEALNTASFESFEEIDPTQFGPIDAGNDGSFDINSAPTSDVGTMEDLDPTAGDGFDTEPLFDDAGMTSDSFDSTETQSMPESFDTGAIDDGFVQPEADVENDVESQPAPESTGDEMTLMRWNSVWMPSPRFVLSTLHAQARSKPEPIAEVRISLALPLSSPAAAAIAGVRFEASTRVRPDAPLRNGASGVMVARLRTAGGLDVLAYTQSSRDVLTQPAMAGVAAPSGEVLAMLEPSVSLADASPRREETPLLSNLALTRPTIIAMADR